MLCLETSFDSNLGSTSLSSRALSELLNRSEPLSPLHESGMTMIPTLKGCLES